MSLTATLGGPLLVNSKKRFIVITRFLILVILLLLLFYDSGKYDRQALTVILVYALTNVFVAFMPPVLFEPTRVLGWFFAFDTAAVSVLLWFVRNGGSELYLVYYLTIFMAAIARSSSAAFFTCVVSASLYALLTFYGKTRIQIDSFPFAIRTIFFFVTAMFIGYLAEETRKEREAKESTLTLLRTTRRLASLFEVSRRMVSVMGLSELHRHILEVAMEVLGADSGSVLLLDAEKKVLRISAAVGIPDDVCESFSARVGEGICGWVALKGEPLLLSGGLEQETRFHPIAPRRQIVSAICAPLRVGDQMLGVINLNKVSPGSPFSPDDLNLLVTLANFAAIVLEKARLHASLDVAHADLRVVADELAALFETANDAIFVFSVEDGRIRKVNYEASRLSGIPRKDLQERDFRALFAPRDRDKLDSLIARTTRTGSAKADNLSVLRSDGTEVPVRISASLTGYGKREVIQAVVGDISDRKKMEQHLARTERLRALGEVASGVAHDFGNIIGAILGYCQRLQRTVQDESAKKALDIIEKSARDGAQIVRRIQDATRTRSVQSYAPVCLADIVRDSIAYTRSRWKDLLAKGVRIEVREKINFEGHVRGNAAELREVFTNILLNATDAMPSGGVIAVEVGGGPETAYVKISDTGVGMTADVKEKIFDPFFSTKGPEGSGLGLSIAYSIIAAHQGRIDVESEVGKGSTFTVLLPVTREAPGAGSLPRPAPPAIPKLKYLVIDDDPRICQLVSDILAPSGSQVFTALNGAEGISLWELHAPDIVFTDYKMEGLSGIEVSRRIKEKNPRTLVIIITAARSELSDEDVTKSLADYVLSKPFGEADVAQAIAAAMSQKGATS